MPPATEGGGLQEIGRRIRREQGGIAKDGGKELGDEWKTIFTFYIWFTGDCCSLIVHSNVINNPIIADTHVAMRYGSGEGSKREVREQLDGGGKAG